MVSVKILKCQKEMLFFGKGLSYPNCLTSPQFVLSSPYIYRGPQPLWGLLSFYFTLLVFALDAPLRKQRIIS